MEAAALKLFLLRNKPKNMQNYGHKMIHHDIIMYNGIMRSVTYVIVIFVYLVWLLCIQSVISSGTKTRKSISYSWLIWNPTVILIYLSFDRSLQKKPYSYTYSL
jgi:hypothetical protein